MDIYNKYKSPLGYDVGNGNIDSYGVDHSNFSLRDEIEYQTARSKREQDFIKNYNSQGINKNYPQAGTNFWGSSAENNYGFGSSNITSAISAHPAMNNTPITLQTVQTSIPQEQTSASLSNGYSNSLNDSQSNPSTWDNVKNFAQNTINTIAPYTPTYYVGYGIGTVQNMLPQTINNLANAYNIYNNRGLYSVGEKYAEPSVRRALQAKKDITPLDISDVNKHQYVSCVGSADGLLATAETLIGGAYKELQDTKDKLSNPRKRAAYGGLSGILSDARKDFGNDLIGSTVGYIAGNYNIPEACELLLDYPIKYRK